MSRVYFESRSGDAELQGSERYWADHVSSGVGRSQFGEFVSDRDPILRCTNVSPQELPQRLRTHWMGEPFVWKGLVIRQWPLELNTALLLGNDYVRLLARVHAQCEIHGWIDGPNRSWFAELIDGGRAVGLFRADQGWEDVATFMRANDTDPVAMSYSVTDSFLSGEWVPDEYKTYDENGYYDMDRWEDVPDDQKWHLGEAWLRSDHADNELKPENWSGLYFGHMLSYFDLMRSDNEAVLESKRDALVADQANVKANVLG